MVTETIFSLIKAFAVGGAICAVCQTVIDRTRLTPARILVSLVVLGVILTAVGVYAPFAEWAGCGATVPLLGFGCSLAKGVREAVDGTGLLGALTGGLTACAGGITAATVFGYLASLFSRSHDK